jgi:glycosyltransferase involved in cell wall biosynthesis
VHEQFHKEVVFGFCGRSYSFTPRKRMWWVDKLREDFEGRDVKFLCTDGKLPFDMLPQFYKSIDYLVVPSTVEGGPLPLLESLCMGTPVIIGKNVGWEAEYPTVTFDGTYGGLASKIDQLVPDNDKLWGLGEVVLIDTLKELCM